MPRPKQRAQKWNKNIPSLGKVWGKVSVGKVRNTGIAGCQASLHCAEADIPGVSGGLG